jgi:hypothetical protein
MANYKYLNEQPVKDQLSFGHKEILDTLQSIVSSCETPFTIGLFGTWGSGKSSIAEGLRDRLIHPGIPVVLFDVWKHEGDALRRTFLMEIDRQLKSKPYGESFLKNPRQLLSERLTGQTQNTKTKLVTLNPKHLSYFIAIALGVVIFFIGASYAINCFFLDKFKAQFNEVFTITTIVGVVVWLISTLKDFSPSSEISLTQDKITDPYDFESEFSNIISNLSNSRIVIIFDNLDRVSGENALETISTIKTFLEPVDKNLKTKQIVFLIPCDVDAIKKHLKKVLRDDVDHDVENYADEFLRKFFNTILWIPEFYSTELEIFATNKLHDTKIPEFRNDHLAWLIIQVFRDNPRQIIQFINILITNYLLMENKSQQGAFGELNFHKNNVPQLAKFLLLVQKFPEIMQKYKQTQTFDLDQDILDAKEQKQASFKRFSDFRMATSDVVIKTLEPFFNFKISDQEKALPGISRLFQQIQDESYENATDYAREIRLDQHVNIFSDVVITYLSPKKNSVVVCVFLNGLFQITRALSITLKQNTYREIIKKLEEASTINIEKIDPQVLVSEFFEKGANTFNKTVKEKILVRWVAVFNEAYASPNTMPVTPEYKLRLLTSLIEYTDELKPLSLQQLTTGLTQYCSYDLQICSLLINHSRVDSLLTSPMVTAMIGNLNLTSDTDAFTKMTSLIKKVPANIRQNVAVNHVFRKIGELFVFDVRKKGYEGKKIAIENIHDLIRLYINDFNSVNDQSVINILSDNVLQGYNQSEWSERCFYIPIFCTLQKSSFQILRDYGKNVSLQFFQNMQNISPEDVNYVLKKLDDPQEILDRSEHKSYVNNLVQQSVPFFKILYGYVAPDTQKTWILSLLNANNFKFLNDTLAEINSSEIPSSQEIFSTLINRMRTLPDRKQISEAYNFMEAIAVEPSKLDNATFQKLIFDLVQNPNLQEVTPGYFSSSKFMNDESRIKVATMILSKLNNDPYNEIALNLIQAVYRNLTTDLQSRFCEILFSRLLLGPASESWISVGSNLVQKLNIELTIDKIESLKSKAIEYQTAGRSTYYKVLLTEISRLLEIAPDGESSKIKTWATAELAKVN